jgi:FlaA1/EpsC-like NDP-sugar epimerase
MIELFLNKYSNRFVSRHFVLALDIIIVIGSFLAASVLRFNFDVTQINWSLYKYYLFILVAFRFVCFLYFRSYEGIVRHTSIEDASAIFKSTVFGTLIVFVVSFSLTKFTGDVIFHIPVTILIIEFFISLCLMISSRVLVKSIYKTLIVHAPGEKVDVLIYGAGTLGIITKNTLLNNRHQKYNILGFIDDNPTLTFRSIQGVRVFTEQEAVRRFINDETTEDIEVILAIHNIKATQKSRIIDTFLKRNIVVKVVQPVLERLQESEITGDEIRKIKIEDLLEREPIMLDTKKISYELANKTALITGASGSIGSEIVRQIIRFQPHTVILLDQAESGLYDLEVELRQYFKRYLINTKLLIEVANVSDEVRMRQIFNQYHIDYIFHAAAYKHVPLMEAHPYESIKTNVFGTKIVADLAVEYNVKKFVMISTDKAVNPTNVMGATKRLAEMYVQSLNERFSHSTQFITTRFGNVLGSNGSVVPLFQKQIQAGGPITVTHPDVIRYFMTIPEACQLVLEAGTMGQGGEVFVFDMGDAVKIADLAQKMIQLSGPNAIKNIKIKYTGLRPGEKLYEELLSDKEHTLPTYHPKIKIAQVYTTSFVELTTSLQQLYKELRTNEKNEIVAHLKYLVPEFISNNSVFEQLDNVELVGTLPQSI